MLVGYQGSNCIGFIDVVNILYFMVTGGLLVHRSPTLALRVLTVHSTYIRNTSLSGTTVTLENCIYIIYFTNPSRGWVTCRTNDGRSTNGHIY